jgi:AcrR family transcriptional regulator
MTTMSSTATTAPGRPRDPGVDRRIADAAIDVFGELGWEGFTVEGVAKRAGVGKASIYLRWPTKAALLVDAVQSRVTAVSRVRAENVREELIELASQLMASYLPDSGRSMLRLSLEADRIPGLQRHWDAVAEAQIRAARDIVHRAVARGELPKGTSATLVLDTLCGGVMMHALSAPVSLKALQRAKGPAYVEKLVDFVLAAAGG